MTKLLVTDPITDATETAASAVVRNMATGEERIITDAVEIRALYDDPTAKSYGEGSYTVDQTSEIEITARANCLGALKSHKFLVATDGTVRVYDDVAGHYTRCHSMTPRTVARIRSLARKA